MSPNAARSALAGLLALGGCVGAIAADAVVPFSRAAYDAVANEKALILVSANFGRRWKCGAFENAQLQSVGFDRAGSGHFSAVAGEVVYIGHFALDCAQAPMPWRYYPEDKSDFTKYLELVSKEYSGLPAEEAKFRVFETTVMGNPLRVPE